MRMPAIMTKLFAEDGREWQCVVLESDDDER
jgi:hypothetical protein